MLLKSKKEYVTPDNSIPPELQHLCVPMTAIKVWGNNPRYNDEAAKKLAALIKVHGFRKPIVVDQNGIIRAGNTAYKAARILGMKSIPVVKSTFKSEAAATAYGISDNKASEFALWDDEILKDLMEMEELAKNTEQTGFTEKELFLFSSGSKVNTKRGMTDAQKQWKASIRIEKIEQDDCDYILGLINSALEGTKYEAKLAK